MKDAKVILFTDFFPFGISSENGFLRTELVYLAKRFDTVIIVPRYFDGEGIGEENLFSNDNVVIELGLANYLKRRKRILKLLWSAATSSFFQRELINLLRDRGRLPHRTMLALETFAYAFAILEWLDRFIFERQIDIKSTVFYTYWLSKATTGIGFLKKNHRELLLVSRAHRFDLYIDCQPELYFPYRSQTLAQLNELHLISNDGFAHILAFSPEYKEKYRVSRLGVKNPEFRTKSSDDGIFRIVSCSYVKDVKRLDLLVAGLNSLGNSKPKEFFRWDHFGDGPLFEEIKILAQELPKNVEYKFWGGLSNRDIIRYYQNNPIDVFINVSRSEGIPVSIMEAQSCGIPVIATSVGGIPEIVNSANGILLKADIIPAEIGDAVWTLLSDATRMREKKRASFEMWQNRYDADINFESFSAHLYHLLSPDTVGSEYQI